MIVRVCKRVAQTGFQLAVATDDERIAKVVGQAGFKAVMTSSHHRSGTERIEEALRLMGSKADVVINVQGDEPFIDPRQILSLADIFRSYPDTELATLARPFPPSGSYSDLADPNLVKLEKTPDGKALTFTRSVVPCLRGVEKQDWPRHYQYLTHIGIYGYKVVTLRRIVDLAPTPLEQAESLEQLRWLENGMQIRVAESDFPTIGIDTPEDLEAAEAWLSRY